MQIAPDDAIMVKNVWVITNEIYETDAQRHLFYNKIYYSQHTWFVLVQLVQNSGLIHQACIKDLEQLQAGYWSSEEKGSRRIQLSLRSVHGAIPKDKLTYITEHTSTSFKLLSWECVTCASFFSVFTGKAFKYRNTLVHGDVGSFHICYVKASISFYLTTFV